ncbi:DUF1285 domain-containing protein [Kiloniella sp. b19]|uniref:DUF1285 domain-containing protein n=1 Tax=Kiloniella sp. GXU_MW_B19 TaxID=3141326 RepID=UPI0031DDA9CC
MSLPEQCANDSIEIRKDGRWFHEGGLIARPQLVKLFSTVLRREEDGSYWLVTPVERTRVRVEDAPYLGLEVKEEFRGEGPRQLVSLRTNIDQWITFGPENPLRVVADEQTGEPSLYAELGKGLEARLVRSAWFHLVELSESRGRDFGFWSDGVFHVLGDAE